MEQHTVLHASLFRYRNIGLNAEVEALTEEILDNYSKFPPASGTNPGCWRGTQDLVHLDFLKSKVLEYVNNKIDYYAKIDKIFAGYAKKCQFEIQYWTNVNSPGARNVMHTHKSSVFSGVYYLQGEGTGYLRIMNPANILSDCNSAAPFARDFLVNPKDKDLIIWPSWLPHEVESNMSKKKRINIAFNVCADADV